LTTHGLPHDGDGYSEALDYNCLPEPWREWAKIARNFAYQVDSQDREDLMQDIIVELAKIAEKYRQMGKPLTKWGCIKAAEYRRLRFYHEKHRWKRVFSVSLNSIIKDEHGYETEMMQTIPDGKQPDLDAWLDAKNYYQNSSPQTRRAVRKLLTENWRKLSGYDWKLIRQFRTDFAKT